MGKELKKILCGHCGHSLKIDGKLSTGLYVLKCDNCFDTEIHVKMEE